MNHVNNQITENKEEPKFYRAGDVFKRKNLFYILRRDNFEDEAGELQLGFQAISLHDGCPWDNFQVDAVDAVDELTFVGRNVEFIIK